MEYFSPAKTHIAIATQLDIDPKGKKFDNKMHRGMFDSLLYLTVSRPDIKFVAFVCKISG